MTVDVSVVIPTYNRRAMVREAVDSVLSNRGVEFELIVVDDGSTDDTPSLPACFGRSATAQFIYHRTSNRGVAAARNRGVEIASAPLIAFLDSDDLWMPGKLARQVAFMREHPDCRISQTNEIWIRGGKRVNPGIRHRKRAGDIFIDSLRTCLISPSAVTLRTDLFRSMGGFDESMTAAEDSDLWLRILVDREVGLLDEPLVTRRAGHRDQLSAITPAIDRFRILALTKLLASEQLAGPRREAVATVLAAKCGIYAGGLHKRGRTDAAKFYEWVASRAPAWQAYSNSEVACALTSMRARLCENHS